MLTIEPVTIFVGSCEGVKPLNIQHSIRHDITLHYKTRQNRTRLYKTRSHTNQRRNTNQMNILNLKRRITNEI